MAGLGTIKIEDNGLLDKIKEFQSKQDEAIEMIKSLATPNISFKKGIASINFVDIGVCIEGDKVKFYLSEYGEEKYTIDADYFWIQEFRDGYSRICFLTDRTTRVFVEIEDAKILSVEKAYTEIYNNDLEVCGVVISEDRDSNFTVKDKRNSSVCIKGAYYFKIKDIYSEGKAIIFCKGNNTIQEIHVHNGEIEASLVPAPSRNMVDNTSEKQIKVATVSIADIFVKIDKDGNKTFILETPGRFGWYYSIENASHFYVEEYPDDAFTRVHFVHEDRASTWFDVSYRGVERKNIQEE